MRHGPAGLRRHEGGGAGVAEEVEELGLARGPNGELWKIERDLAPLLRACRQILSPQPRFVLLTVYTIDASSLLCGNLLTEMTAGLGGRVEIGELALRHDRDARLLPLSLWGRWQAR